MYIYKLCEHLQIANIFMSGWHQPIQGFIFAYFVLICTNVCTVKRLSTPQIITAKADTNDGSLSNICSACKIHHSQKKV